MTVYRAAEDVLSGLAPNVFSIGGLGVFLGVIVLAFFRGWVVAGSQVTRMDASYRKQLDDAWAAHAAASARADMLLAQQQRLLEIAYLTRDAATRRLEGMSDEMA